MLKPGATCEHPEAAAHYVLRDIFGLDNFKPGQMEIVTSILRGDPTFAIMATGFGKSLCYQIPALALDGVMIVVEPIIALIDDQVGALRRKGVPAIGFHSGVPKDLRRKYHEDIKRGRIKLLYLSPEMLGNKALLGGLGQAGVSRVIVDEAHNISSWGDSFRPAYRTIRDCVDGIAGSCGRDVPIAAFTATAPEEIRQDIECELWREPPAIFLGPTRRRNLTYRVEVSSAKNYKPPILSNILPNEKTLIYAQSVKTVEKIYEALAEEGLEVCSYHGRQSKVDRETSYNNFKSGACQIAVATDAFGMGVDIPDIRHVIHAGLPVSLEQYSQQSGRAGRDGLPAKCTMVVRQFDEKVQQFFVGNQMVSAGDLRKTLDEIDSASSETGESSIVRSPAFYNAINRLISLGIVRKSVGEGKWRYERCEHGPEISDATEGKRTATLIARAKAVADFAFRPNRCLKDILDSHLSAGLSKPNPCGECSFCNAMPVISDTALNYSLILRTVKSIRRRYGVRVVAEILVGDNSRLVIRKNRFDGLATFGAMRQHNSSFIKGLIFEMLNEGLLKKPDNNWRAGLEETAKGRKYYNVFLEGHKRRGQRVSGIDKRKLRFQELEALQNQLSMRHKQHCDRLWAPSVSARIADAEVRDIDDLVGLGCLSPGKVAAYGEEILCLLKTFDIEHK